MTLEQALAAAVAALTSAVVVLWRRDVARSDREAVRLEKITDRLNSTDDCP